MTKGQWSSPTQLVNTLNSSATNISGLIWKLLAWVSHFLKNNTLIDGLNTCKLKQLIVCRRRHGSASRGAQCVWASLVFILWCQFPGPDAAETALQAGLAPIQPQATLGSQETRIGGKIHPNNRWVFTQIRYIQEYRTVKLQLSKL